MFGLDKVYKLITGTRNKLYDKGILKTYSIDQVEVVCIGNITVGGTGKTPCVQYFAKEYLKMGKKVGIVSRGYKGVRDKDPYIVRDYDKIYGTSKEAGDEAFLHSLELQIPIIVGRDRVEACKLMKKKYSVDTIILDDGFQHRRLNRDKNIVLIDATNPFGGGYLLPKGRLREDLSGLERAHEFIITKSDLVDEKEVEEIEKNLKKYGKSIKRAVHGPVKLWNKKESIELSKLEGEKVFLFSALANPKQFEKTVEKFGVKGIKSISFGDHYYYKMEDFERIKRESLEYGAKYLLSTDKDMVKYEDRFFMENLYSLKIEFRILEK